LQPNATAPATDKVEDRELQDPAQLNRFFKLR